MTKTIYISNHDWNTAPHRLILAAHDKADPVTAVQEALASLGVAPESCREDIEANAV
ncbi:hypothetical protein [Mangrovicoccus ximenensis]|uniref:hypothetical protein n=1 Tax=Mangrovicoccus ximenensis TaxID=1911570 RepID=UPI001374E995|nr:hypothetical protein [Mangrovicoccus ximenensis]